MQRRGVILVPNCCASDFGSDDTTVTGTCSHGAVIITTRTTGTTSGMRTTLNTYSDTASASGVDWPGVKG